MVGQQEPDSSKKAKAIGTGSLVTSNTDFQRPRSIFAGGRNLIVLMARYCPRSWSKANCCQLALQGAVGSISPIDFSIIVNVDVEMSERDGTNSTSVQF